MIEVPPTVQRRLSELWTTSRIGKAPLTRVTALKLRYDADRLLERRRSRFDRLDFNNEAGIGTRATFLRFIKRRNSDTYHEVGGTFDVSPIGDDFSLIISALESDANLEGPAYIIEHAYPWATRPFLNFRDLLNVVTEFAKEHNLTTESVLTQGYHKETPHESRRDAKRQPPAQAVEEMRVQDRAVHRMRISFRDRHGEEIYNASFDRTLSMTVYSGDSTLLVTRILQRALMVAQAKERNYAVERTQSVEDQQSLTLSFPPRTFETIASMNAVCGALRNGLGLSVSILHLNPFLHAQVLDYLSGTSYDLVILDDTTLSLIPQSKNDPSSLERITQLIGCFFLESSNEERRSVMTA